MMPRHQTLQNPLDPRFPKVLPSQLKSGVENQV